MTIHISPPPRNPLTQLLAAVVGALVLVGAFMLGLVALAVVVGLGLMLSIAFWLRMAWVRRRLARRRPRAPTGDTATEVIEAEYTVISTKRDT